MRGKTHDFASLIAVAALIIALFGGIPGAMSIHEALSAKLELKLPVEPNVFTSGGLGNNLFVGINTSEGIFGWVEEVDGCLRFDFPGAKNWGACFITAGEAATEKKKRKYMDYSRFAKLSLELRGARGTSVVISIKDRDDPNDGNESQYPLVLHGDGWETHDIELEKFPKADLEKINVVTCFVFDRNPKRFDVRKIQYK